MSVHMKKRYLMVTAVVSGFLFLPAHAQYVGPSGNTAQPSVQKTAQQDVKSILANPVDDQHVTLQGHLLRKQGHEKYIFSDGSGEIVAEIDDDDFPSQPVNEKTKVEIIGEVDTGLRRPPEIEVDVIKVIN